MFSKKGKKKTGYIIGCIALVALLTLSTYISLVVVGVVTDENINNKKPDVTGSGETAVNNDNNYYVDNYYNNVGVTDNGTGVAPAPTPNQNTNTQVQHNNSNPTVSVNQQSVYLRQENKTAADIVKIYADVMNNAKIKAPGFTKVEYQELPDGPENRVISEGTEAAGDAAVNKMLNFVQGLGVFVPKDEAEKNPYVHEKGDSDMSWFPVFEREKGSYLTDPEGIESYSYKVLANGNVKMSFVLVPEDNPEPISENSTVAPSYTGAIFSPMSKARIDGTVYHPIVTVFAKDIKYSLRYHDCSVEVEFNPDNLEIVSLKQIANVSIKGSGDVVGAGFIGLERQELISTVIIKDITY